MDSLNPIQVLAAVRLPSIVRYRENLAKDPKLKVTVVTSEESARAILNDSSKQTDVFVVDNGLGDVFEWIKELRRTHPRLLILLVDEEADFGMPGRADDVSTEPFKEDDMIKKIKRMAEERSLATLRADSLPPVRSFAKALRKATKGLGKQQAAVGAVKDLGYDHVIFYAIAPGEPPALTLGAQVGPNAVTGIMPIRTDYSGILGWVAQNGQSKIIGAGDTPGHILIERGRYGAAVCIPVGLTLRFGVMIAFREQPGTIKQEDIVMLELVCAQLASALAKEQHS
jgi:hypothetical protein